MFAWEISWRLRYRKYSGQAVMCVRTPGLSPVPELATSLFQPCKSSGGTSLTNAGQIFAKMPFCHTDWGPGIYNRNYLWSYATNYLYDAGTASLPTSSLLRIHHHLETVPSLPPMQEHCSQSSVHPTLRNVWGLNVSIPNTNCYGRKELPGIKSLKKKYLWIWQTGNGWKIKNFTYRLLKEDRKISACYTSYLSGLATHSMLVITATEHLANLQPNRNSIQQELVDSQHHNLYFPERSNGVSPEVMARLRKDPWVSGFLLAELIQLTW